MMEDLVERTFAPTPGRREEARREGRVARSSDLTAAAALLAGVLLVSVIASGFIEAGRAWLESAMTDPPAGRREELTRTLRRAAGVLAPMAMVVPVVAILIGAMQTGFLWTFTPLAPRWSRLSPARGLERIFSGQGWARLGMNLGKLAVVVAVAGIALATDLSKLTLTTELEGAALLSAIARIVWGIAVRVAAALVILGVLDWLYQRWRHERELQLTRPQMREELRRTEGDPLVRQRRVALARRIAAERLYGGVAGAQVVIASASGFAIALRYDSRLEAPRVVAKAAGSAADRIRESAESHGVPVVERIELARTLCRHVEVGQATPARFYDQVAEVLAYAYSITGRSPI